MQKNPSLSPPKQLPITEKLIEQHIYAVRNKQVMLDKDLAELYQVPTKRLNEAVKKKPQPISFGFHVSNNTN